MDFIRRAELIPGLLLAVSLAIAAPARAHQAMNPVSPNTVSQSHQLNTAPSSGRAVIQVGSHALSVTKSTSNLTIGERIALQQVLSTGHQSLILNKNGLATGGSFQLSSLGPQVNTGLTIPKGVIGIENVGLLNKQTFAGDFINGGTLRFTSEKDGLTGQINARNFVNLPGGVITSLNNASLNVQFNAAQNFKNEGTIESSGSLAINAANIINANSSQDPAVLQAQTNINLNSSSGVITNSGTISATAGSINVSAPSNVDIALNNSGGFIQANNGSINFRESSYQGAANTTISGGNLSAGNYNINSGQGTVNVSVDELQGTLNVNAGCEHVTAATNTLTLGTMNITGDPTFYNLNGDIVIKGDLIFPGEDLALIATGNIVSSPNCKIISTASTTVSGGNIFMMAGADFKQIKASQLKTPTPIVTHPNENAFVISGASKTGGSIELSAGGGIVKFDTSSDSSVGGEVYLTAFAGSSPDSGIVKIPSRVSITTGGRIQGGSVEIEAGAPTGTAISIGSISSGSGSIAISAAQPILQYSVFGIYCCGVLPSPRTQPVPSLIVRAQGSVTSLIDSVGIVPQFESTHGSISCKNLTTAGANSIALYAGGNINTGAIQGSETLVLMNAGGDIAVHGSINATSSNNGSNVSIYANNVLIGGSVKADSTSTGHAGIIEIAAVQNLSIVGSVTANAHNGCGGTIFLSAQSGVLTLTQGTIGADGQSPTAPGNGGNIFLSAGEIKVVQPDGSAATSTLNLSASSGSLSGEGGFIAVTTQRGDITIGNKPGNITISDLGGGRFVPILNGNFGFISIAPCCVSISTISFYEGMTGQNKVFISSGGNLTFDTSAFAAGPVAGKQANGINITLVSQGNLLVNGNLSADAGGNANGGDILLASNSREPFVLSPGATDIVNGVNGTISATGHHGGNLIIATAGSHLDDLSLLDTTPYFTTSTDTRIQYSSLVPSIINFDPAIPGTISHISFSDISTKLPWIPTPTNNLYKGANFPTEFYPLTYHTGGIILFPSFQLAPADQGLFWFPLTNSKVQMVPLVLASTPSLPVVNQSQSTFAHVQNSSNTLVLSAASNPLSPVIAAHKPLDFDSSTIIGNATTNSSTAISTDVTKGETVAVVSNSNFDDSMPSHTPFATASKLSCVKVDSSQSTIDVNFGDKLLLTPDKEMEIHTPFGGLHLGEGCVAVVVSTGNGVVVFALHNTNDEDITATVGDQSISLIPGQKLVLTRDNIADVPTSQIACRRESNSVAHNGTKICTAEFSIMSAFQRIPQLQQMLNSPNKNEHSLANRIMLNAAIISQIASSHGAYQSPRN